MAGLFSAGQSIEGDGPGSRNRLKPYFRFGAPIDKPSLSIFGPTWLARTPIPIP